MSPCTENPQPRVQADEALRLILEGTVSETGREFFRALVRNLCLALKTQGAWVTEYLPASGQLRSLAFWFGDGWIEHYEYEIAGTPCQAVIEQKCLAHFPERIVELFPEVPDLPRFDAVSYLGIPIFDTDNTLLGHLAVLDDKPMSDEPQLLTVFEVFAARAAAEYRRMRGEDELRLREDQLARLFDSAMDAIIVFDVELTIVRANPAAERLFSAPEGRLEGIDVRELLTPSGAREVERGVRRLAELPPDERRVWLPQGLQGRSVTGQRFPAEATLSAFESRQGQFATLILRDVNDREEAQRQIALLSQEAEYLREIAHEALGGDELLGDSLAMRELLAGIARVAGTDATVLLLGETGTGKENVARSLHRRSRRREKPLVRVNCAAIPGTLVESELFGHEKGAFTGATQRRQGRFALADGGTIFLDEVGELPLELQAKLLRVLQEGEFEPVGSGESQRVDVRVIAATNRDLETMVREGSFREDLFYRLNVFPIRVPPLRDRGDDVVLLADAFATRFARRMGRRLDPLEPAAIERLLAYRWPGNVRELQNVIERAIILSSGRRLEIERALPEAADRSGGNERSTTTVSDQSRILTAAELRQIERDNLVRALEASSWKISGQGGVAARLGLPASTVSSRMKALGLRRPARR